MPLVHAALPTGLALAALALAGCGGGGSNVADVRGTVKVDGKPLEAGTMSFLPVKGETGTAGCAIKDGQYAARVPVGVMRVTISAPKVIGERALYPDDPKSPKAPIKEESLPARYNQQSTLELDVKPGVNEKDWDLKVP